MNITNLLLRKLRPGSEAKYNAKTVSSESSDVSYFFTHVPKTGGTSFIVFLDRFFPSQAIHQPQLWWEVGNLAEVREKNYQLFRGHLGGQTGALLSDKTVKHITLVRDPVKLAYSTYQFVKRIKETALHELVNKENMSFETFLAHPKTQHLVSDRLVHNFCYGHGVDKEAVDFELNENNFPAFRKMASQGMKTLSEPEKLKKSLQFLDDCFWVGVLEQFDHAVRLLSYQMVWPPMGNSQKLNTHKKPPEISEEAYEVAKELNQLDMTIYEAAKERFDSAIQKMYSSLAVGTVNDEEELDRAIDSHYQKNYLRHHNKSLSDGVEYNCAQVLLGSQWHRREWSEIEKKYFRWSGPSNRSSIDFWVNNKNYQVTVDVVDAISSETLDQLAVWVGGKKLAHEWKGRGCKRQLVLTVSKQQIKSNGLLRLEFVVPKVEKHAAIFSHDDERLVGFAFNQINVVPV